VESHDQALVGDKTMIFRLADANMYTDMDKSCHNPVIDRAIALHKMIRLFTMAGGGEGYLNFMGNEFGHPEWIDFPREGNGWSFHYCRRQWSLLENGLLKYQWLGLFDRDMIAAAKEANLFDQRMGELILHDEARKLLVFRRNGLMFLFNFHHTDTALGLKITVADRANYSIVLDSDAEKYGGFGNVIHKRYPTKNVGGVNSFEITLPPRTAVVLREKKVAPRKPADKK